MEKARAADLKADRPDPPVRVPGTGLSPTGGTR